MAETAPLILTLTLDPASFARLDALRRAHFPPERNQLPAHLTLFHALPGEALAEIRANLAVLASGTPPMALRFAGLRSLGRGTAVVVESPALAALRGMLVGAWHSRLTPQDRQGFRPHVTIQNFVTPDAARDLVAEGLQAFEGQGTGMGLWHYRGGPWEAVEEFEFKR
ncbi:2'-5' RNA ligase family protein [Roseomonas sp. 18066]|uniref:2'-5' RNA ligase family protein n=1 Tax=Roseomonas sp. 18066 TaxID=2681412 RepID=UPI00135989DF|nr:2'-5' RNA ligase family protein [Roseomonas sp. 18066]